MMLGRRREHGLSKTAAASIEWREGSALSLPFASNSFAFVLCQLGLQFFPDRPLAIREMKRVLVPSGRVGLSVYSAIERTSAASALASALDHCLGSDASRIKRGEHVFPLADEVGVLMTRVGFEHANVGTVVKRITFPSVVGHVRFQLVATQMARLLGDRNAVERESLIAAVASDTQSRLDSDMLRDGRLSFPQEVHVAIAHSTR